MQGTPDPPDYAADATAAHGLAADLQKVKEEANGMPMSVGRLVDVLSERGNAVAIVLLAAPFIILPVPGVSTAFGVVLLGLSLGVMLGRKPPLPGFVRRREIPPALIGTLADGTGWVLRKFGRFVRPRAEWATDRRLHWAAGVSLVLCTIAFALPLPIPLNNAPPAIGLVLLALGLAERDGLLTIIGHVYTVLMWLVMILCAVLFWATLKTYVFSKLARGGGSGAEETSGAAATGFPAMVFGIC